MIFAQITDQKKQFPLTSPQHLLFLRLCENNPIFPISWQDNLIKGYLYSCAVSFAISLAQALCNVNIFKIYFIKN